MRIFNFIMAAIFLSFAALQYNDPDPLIWISIYGSMTLFCIGSNFKRLPKYVPVVLALLFIGYCAVLSPSVLTWLRSEDRGELFDELAKMKNLYIEETREFLGLIICLFVLAINAWRPAIQQ